MKHTTKPYDPYIKKWGKPTKAAIQRGKRRRKIEEIEHEKHKKCGQSNI